MSLLSDGAISPREVFTFPRYQSLAITAIPKSTLAVVVVLKFLNEKPFTFGSKPVL